MIKATQKNQIEKGFTLIEVLVAIMVGLVVMGMAVVILGATNSTSLRVLSKSEVQQNSRDAMLKIFNQVADAESLDVCRVGVDKTAQDTISSAAEPGQAGLAISACKETTSSGYVVAWARPNQMCYFKTEKTNTVIVTTVPEISSKPPKIFCVTRGGVGRTRDYEGTLAVDDPTQTPNAGTNLNACLNFSGGTSQNQVFTYECNPTSVASGVQSSINWPSNYGTPVNVSLISDLGSNLTEDPNVNLFKYTLDDGSILRSVVGETALKKIVASDVNLRGKYRTGVGSEVKNYFFQYTIIFRGSLLAQEERANEQ